MSSSNLLFRLVTPDDLPAVADIYHHYVLHSTCTFEEAPRPSDQWLEWLEEHTGRTPAIVAIEAGEVVGWGSLSRWNTRCAYRFSVEDSVYVRPDCHRRGVGRGILGELIRLAREHRHRNLVAQIADHQAASESLHEQLGFTRVGCLEGVGYKFNRWIDVVIWQLKLRYDDDDRPGG